MAENQQAPIPEQKGDFAERAMGIWERYSKQLMIGLGAVVVIVGGYFGYKYFVSGPNETRANDAIFHAQEYFAQDSIRLALEGDGANPGFLKVISKYSGTAAANIAHFYAGSCYIKLGDFSNAVKQLESFSTSEPLLNARAKALTGDAYAELGKKEEAVKMYKAAGTVFEKDEFFSPQYLFRAAYLAESMGKTQDAIALYKLIKQKYPQYREYDIDKYLARLGAVE